MSTWTKPQQLETRSEASLSFGVEVKTSTVVICKQTAFIQNRNEPFDITSVILTNFVNYVCNSLWHLCKLHLYYKLLWTLSNLKTECRTNIISERNVGNKLFGLLEFTFSVKSWRLVHVSPCVLWLIHTKVFPSNWLLFHKNCLPIADAYFIKPRNECWLS